MDLATLQAAFLDRVLGRPSAIDAEVAVRPGVAAGQRLDIYVHAYRGRLLETLQSTFEKTWAYLGDAGFEAAALAYVAARAPATRTLRDYGDGFADHLAAAHPEDPDIADLARLDWTLRRAFDGPDAEPLAAEAFAALGEADWATVVLQLHPTLAVIRVRSNAVQIWRALEAGEPPPAAVELDAPAPVRVWRRGERPHFRTLAEDEASALAWMAEGAGFAATCERLAMAAPDADTTVRAGEMLASWMADELIVGLV